MGIEADSGRLDKLLEELEGKDIAEVIGAGISKLASVPSGAGGGMAAAGGGGGGGGAGLNDGCGADFVQKERAVPAGCQDVPSGARSALHSLGAGREHARVL